jgi:hypothetical protein
MQRFAETKMGSFPIGTLCVFSASLRLRVKKTSLCPYRLHRTPHDWQGQGAGPSLSTAARSAW